MKPYKEIFKLKDMLTEADIPFSFAFMSYLGKKDNTCGRYQICYPRKGYNQYISVIEGFGTYGAEDDLLEIMGGFTPYEQQHETDGVIGYLTAENVFERIKNHYDSQKERRFI